MRQERRGFEAPTSSRPGCRRPCGGDRRQRRAMAIGTCAPEAVAGEAALAVAASAALAVTAVAALAAEAGASSPPLAAGWTTWRPGASA